MKALREAFLKVIDEDLIIIWQKGKKRISLNSFGVRFKGSSNTLILPYLVVIYMILIIFLVGI